MCDRVGSNTHRHTHIHSTAAVTLNNTLLRKQNSSSRVLNEPGDMRRSNNNHVERVRITLIVVSVCQNMKEKGSADFPAPCLHDYCSCKRKPDALINAPDLNRVKWRSFFPWNSASLLSVLSVSTPCLSPSDSLNCPHVLTRLFLLLTWSQISADDSVFTIFLFSVW